MLDLKDGTKVEGKLLSWQTDSLDLEIEEKQKGRKISLKTLAFPSVDILKAKVTVSFK